MLKLITLIMPREQRRLGESTRSFEAAYCFCLSSQVAIMSKRGMDASLAEQMDRLKKTMHSRDERRDKDREKRMVRFSGAIFESA